MPIAFEAIDPGKFNIDAFAGELKKEMKPIAEGIERDYRSGFETWEPAHWPEVITEIVINPYGGAAITVDVIGDIYEMVHEGTAPHFIPASPGKPLAFQETYTAKTIPNLIRSRPGGPSGATVFSSRGVYHPGFEGRNQSKLIMEKWRPAVKRAVQRGLNNGAKKSGHQIK